MADPSVSLAWLSFIEGIALTIGGIVLSALYRAFKVGQWAKKIDYGDRVTALEKRMEQAGLEMSDYATELQALPEHLRKEFITRNEFDVRADESARDRARIWGEINRIWQALDRRGPSRRESA